MSALAEIQERVQSTGALIKQYQRTLRPDSPRSVLANIRALEKLQRRLQREFEEAAAQEEMDVYYYRILNKDRITINGLTSAWREFQDALAVVYSSIKSGGAIKEKPKRSRRKGQTLLQLPKGPSLELGFGYVFSGSLGVTLTLPNHVDGLFADPAIEKATAEIFELVEAYEDREKVREIARRLGPEPVNAVYRWVEAHVSNGYGVAIEWKRDIEHERKMLCQHEELQALRDDLSQTTVDQLLEVTGDLVAVDTEAYTFRIRLDEGKEIEGKYDDAITAEQAASVPARYSALIRKSTKIVLIEGAPQPESYFLQSLKPL